MFSCLDCFFACSSRLFRGPHLLGALGCEVIAAMDAFWNKTFQAQGAEKWNVRGLKIEDAVREKVNGKASGSPVRCLEMGTYCGWAPGASCEIIQDIMDNTIYICIHLVTYTYIVICVRIN